MEKSSPRLLPADEALEKRGSIDFSKQVAKARAILKRSKLYI